MNINGLILGFFVIISSCVSTGPVDVAQLVFEIDINLENNNYEVFEIQTVDIEDLESLEGAPPVVTYYFENGKGPVFVVL